MEKSMLSDSIKMMKSIFSGVMYSGRAAVFTLGLAVILALVLGVAATALAANGEPFVLGRNNVATAVSRLAGAVGVDGSMLLIDNNNVGPRATALDLRVEPGKAPMRVNSDTRVTKLNADLLDGQDSGAFLGANQKAADADKLDGRELSTGRITRNQNPGGVSVFVLLRSGALTFVAVCENSSSGSRATVEVRSAETNSAVSAHSAKLGGVERYPLNPGVSMQIASTGPNNTPVAGVVDHVTYSAVAPNGDTLQGEVFAGVNMQGSTCVFSASGIG
jgi:hypothetical protein